MTAPVSQPCQQWRLKLAATHPADLEPAERAALEAHIATCAGCAAAYAAYLRLDAAVQRLPGPAPLEGLPPKLLALWAAEDQQEPDAHAPARFADRARPLRSQTLDTRPASVFPERPAPRRPSLRLASGLTALAAVLVIALVIAALLASRLHFNIPPTIGPGPQQTTAPTVGATQPPTTGPTVTTTPGTTYPVEVFFSRHPDSDNNPSLVYPVQRTAPDSGVATFALKQLFLGPTAAEQSQRYYSDFMGNLGTTNYCSDKSKVFTISLNHRGTKSETGTATVMLCVQVAIPGDLSGARMKAMITKTVLQFPNNKNVVILNYQGNCFDDLQGGNLCLQG